MTIHTLPIFPKYRTLPNGGIDVEYMRQLIDTLEQAIDTLNVREPLKNNVIENLAAGDRIQYDGKTWRNLPGGVTTFGDVAGTLTPLTSSRVNYWSTTLTADRAVTLSTTNAFDGCVFHIARPASGAFNLNVGTGPLAALAASEWCEVTYDAGTTAWILTAKGSLA